MRISSMSIPPMDEQMKSMRDRCIAAITQWRLMSDCSMSEAYEVIKGRSLKLQGSEVWKMVDEKLLYDDQIIANRVVSTMREIHRYQRTAGVSQEEAYGHVWSSMNQSGRFWEWHLTDRYLNDGKPLVRDPKPPVSDVTEDDADEPTAVPAAA